MSEINFNLRAVGICDRMLSDRELVGRRDGDDPDSIRSAAYELARVRRVISIICGENARGRVLVGSTLRVRRALQSMWLPPLNADFVHFNALRGVDFARAHWAAISVGRQELAPEALSGLAMALSYDEAGMQASPAKPSNGRSIEKRRLMLRDGRDVIIKVPIMADAWERLIEKQSREEELKQFAGRLRPLLREGIPPVWYAMTQALPSEFVWDDLVSSSDILSRVVGDDRLPRNLWEVARRTGGLICPHLALEDCPDLCTEQLIPEIFEMEGVDLRSGNESEPFKRNWNKILWQDGTGRKHSAWASPWLQDVTANLRARLQNARYDVRALDLVRRVQPTGYPKPADDVDRKVGSRLDSKKEEDRLRSAHYRTLKRSAVGRLQLGEIGLQADIGRHGVLAQIYLEARVAENALSIQH